MSIDIVIVMSSSLEKKDLEIDLIKATPLDNFKTDDFHKLKKVELVKMIRLERAENSYSQHFTIRECRKEKKQLTDDINKIKDIMSIFDYEPNDDDDHINKIKQIVDRY
eukprot:SAG22_NODE_1114_length_5527_cov_206.317797_2_plen_109_part_00